MTNETQKDNDSMEPETLLNEAKDTYQAIKEKKYFAATRQIFHLLSHLYKRYLKGKYVPINGKKIPLVLVLAVVLFLGWLAAPSDTETPVNTENSESKQLEEQIKTKEDLNSYNQDGIKVYGMYKCDNAVCGFLENESDNDVARILISVTFHDKGGAVIYEGGAEATAMIAKSRSRFKISSDGDFDYFRLTDVTVEK
ncbi:MAG: FxLYD domain-containing protein [Pseudomonadota bacterium]|nr:FxLYD domain-containing protein [Pseudomonadota bacterium]